MGQSSSSLKTATVSHPRLANFFHICNIIPDTPEHGYQVWSPPEEWANAQPLSPTGQTVSASTPTSQSTTHSTTPSTSRDQHRHCKPRKPRASRPLHHLRNQSKGGFTSDEEDESVHGESVHTEGAYSDSPCSDVSSTGSFRGGETRHSSYGGGAGGAGRWRRRRRRNSNLHPHSAQSLMGQDQSQTDYTTDDESDSILGGYGGRRRSRGHRTRHQRSERRVPSTSTTPASAASATTNTPQTSTSTPTTLTLPQSLDHRYDLDIAPSMLNMNLKFNGAYMVASVLYSIFASKYRYRHMLSVQMLFWCAIQKYYQSPLLDTQANYKISLSALLDIAQHIPLCSERELSIYTDVAERHHAHTKLYEDTVNANSSGNGSSSSTSTSSSSSSSSPTKPTTFGTHHLRPRTSPSARLTKPFYRMQHYYVPKDTPTLQRALCCNHLILANLTLFSNFLSARQGVVQPPNTDDVPAGMVVITLIGYQEGVWIARFPFGMHWGDQGVGYISHEYFDRYNRDRWIVEMDECGEPPEYRHHREQEQASGNALETGLLAVHMNQPSSHLSSHLSSQQMPSIEETAPMSFAQESVGQQQQQGRRRRMCA